MEQKVILVSQHHILGYRTDQQLSEGEAQYTTAYGADHGDKDIFDRIHATDLTVPDTDRLHHTDLMEILHDRKVDGKPEYHKGYDDQRHGKHQDDQCNDHIQQIGHLDHVSPAVKGYAGNLRDRGSDCLHIIRYNVAHAHMIQPAYLLTRKKRVEVLL